MTLIEERNKIVKNLIRAALRDHDLEDEEMLERSEICAAAAMSILNTINDDDAFEAAIAQFSPNAQAVHRELRAAVDRLTHTRRRGRHIRRGAGARAREHPAGGGGA